MAVREALAAASAKFTTLKPTVEHMEQLHPRKPTPTHRFQGVAA